MAETISDSWIKEKNEFLKNKLPKNKKGDIFYPDTNFYAYYYSENLEGLHYMATQIFNWLDIKPNGCTIDFYDGADIEGMSDAAGFYTKIKDENGEKEVIFINSKHKSDCFGVGAILAHEMMHLYLFRLGLKLEDVQENELLTDLATINTGLSILILNGMSYSNQWWLTVIVLMLGRLYWKSEQLAFGYFKPKQYGKHALEYFKEKNIKLENIFGYMNPSSRYFVPHSFTRSKNPTAFIKILEKKRLKNNLFKGIAVAAAAIFFFYINSSGNNSGSSQTGLSSDQKALSSQVDECKSQVGSMESSIKLDQDNLRSKEFNMNVADRMSDAKQYNSMVAPYNSLLAKVNSEISEYDKKLQECNNLVDKYNASIK